MHRYNEETPTELCLTKNLCRGGVCNLQTPPRTVIFPEFSLSTLQTPVCRLACKRNLFASCKHLAWAVVRAHCTLRKNLLHCTLVCSVQIRVEMHRKCTLHTSVHCKSHCTVRSASTAQCAVCIFAHCTLPFTLHTTTAHFYSAYFCPHSRNLTAMITVIPEEGAMQHRKRLER